MVYWPHLRRFGDCSLEKRIVVERIFFFLLLVVIDRTALAQSTSVDNSALLQVLTPEKIDSLRLYSMRFSELKTSKQFRQFYTEFFEFKNSISKTMNDSVYKRGLEMSSVGHYLDSGFTFIEFSYEVEGTVFFLHYKMDVLKSKAGTTKGKEDDSFYKLVSDIYFRDGELNKYAIPAWLNKRGHVSVSSKLGDFTTLSWYKRIQTEQKNNRLFAGELSQLLNEIRKDLGCCGAFDYSKEKVLLELREIAKYDLSVANDIDKRIKEIEVSDYRFDCLINDCQFE